MHDKWRTVFLLTYFFSIVSTEAATIIVYPEGHLVDSCVSQGRLLVKNSSEESHVFYENAYFYKDYDQGAVEGMEALVEGERQSRSFYTLFEILSLERESNYPHFFGLEDALITQLVHHLTSLMLEKLYMESGLGLEEKKTLLIGFHQRYILNSPLAYFYFNPLSSDQLNSLHHSPEDSLAVVSRPEFKRPNLNNKPKQNYFLYPHESLEDYISHLQVRIDEVSGALSEIVFDDTPLKETQVFRDADFEIIEGMSFSSNPYWPDSLAYNLQKQLFSDHDYTFALVVLRNKIMVENLVQHIEANPDLEEVHVVLGAAHVFDFVEQLEQYRPRLNIVRKGPCD